MSCLGDSEGSLAKVRLRLARSSACAQGEEEYGSRRMSSRIAPVVWLPHHVPTTPACSRPGCPSQFSSPSKTPKRIRLRSVARLMKLSARQVLVKQGLPDDWFKPRPNVRPSNRSNGSMNPCFCFGWLRINYKRATDWPITAELIIEVAGHAQGYGRAEVVGLDVQPAPALWKNRIVQTCRTRLFRPARWRFTSTAVFLWSCSCRSFSLPIGGTRFLSSSDGLTYCPANSDGVRLLTETTLSFARRRSNGVGVVFQTSGNSKPKTAAGRWI